MRLPARAILPTLFGLLLSSCASQYFRPAPPPATPSPQLQLSQWPDRDHWWGIVFNGEKIGFSHLAIAPGAAPDTFEIRSDAAFVLRFLGFAKRVNLKSVDTVRGDLDIVRFRYDYTIDGNAVVLVGEREGGLLAVSVEHAGQVTRQSVDATGTLHPQSAVMLYPALHGLSTGREFRYRVYSGELQKATEVVQNVGAYERSTLFDGDAFRVDTRMEGYAVESWIDARGRTLLEIAMNGVLISGLESEQRATAYLTSASLNKSEALVDFSVVRVTPPLANARAATRMRVAVSGTGRTLPSDDVQACAPERARTVCDVVPAGGRAIASDGTDGRYLASTFTVPARHPAIVSLATQVAGDARDAREQARRVLAWLGQHVRKSPADVWSALDVLKTREAECQGHAYLYAALMRALGTPTRVVNGVVYSDEHRGFLYHTWTESVLDGRWVAVDPTFGALPADATHVKLVEGETLAELTPLADWIGRLAIEVVEIR